MAKWMVSFEAVVETKDRAGAWKSAQQLCKDKHDELMAVRAVSLKPLIDPDEWIAINNPIIQGIQSLPKR